MPKVLFIVSLFLGLAGLVAYIVALVRINDYIAETWSDVGNACMLTACFASLAGLHLRKPK